MITGADLAAFLDIPDTLDDPRLALAADAAASAVQDWCGRRFTRSSSTRRLRADDPVTVTVGDFWTLTGLVVKVDETDSGTFGDPLVLDEDFLAEPLVDGHPYRVLVRLDASWPTGTRRRCVEVTAQWGWESAPAAVTQAALLKAARLFKRRNSPEGVLGGFAEWGVVRVSSREDPDVVALLAPYRVGRRAVPVA